MKRAPILSISLVILCSSGCGIGILPKDANSWIAQEQDQPSIDISGKWKSTEWGTGAIVQKGRRFTGTLGEYEVRGTVHGRTVRILFIDDGEIWWSGYLKPTERSALKGEYSARGRLFLPGLGYPMVFEGKFNRFVTEEEKQAERDRIARAKAKKEAAKKEKEESAKYDAKWAGLVVPNCTEAFWPWKISSCRYSWIKSKYKLSEDDFSMLFSGMSIFLRSNTIEEGQAKLMIGKLCHFRSPVNALISFRRDLQCASPPVDEALNWKDEVRKAVAQFKISGRGIRTISLNERTFWTETLSNLYLKSLDQHNFSLEPCSYHPKGTMRIKSQLAITGKCTPLSSGAASADRMQAKAMLQEHLRRELTRTASELSNDCRMLSLAQFTAKYLYGSEFNDSCSPLECVDRVDAACSRVHRGRWGSYCHDIFKRCNTVSSVSKCQAKVTYNRNHGKSYFCDKALPHLLKPLQP